MLVDGQELVLDQAMEGFHVALAGLRPGEDRHGQRTRIGAHGFLEEDGGTLFLDEVGDVPLAQQAKLLRVIEDGAIIPVGASTPITVDVRIVAATNVDLRRAVEDGQFRRDLLDRLEVLTLRLPTLHERPEDVPLLFDHLFATANEAEGTQVRSPNSEVRGELVSACAGGNIRVLKNAVRRLVVVKRRGRVALADLESAGLVGTAEAGRCFATGEGAQRMLAIAVEAEVQAWLEAREHLVDGEGHRLIARNGYTELPPQTIPDRAGRLPPLSRPPEGGSTNDGTHTTNDKRRPGDMARTPLESCTVHCPCHAQRRLRRRATAAIPAPRSARVVGSGTTSRSL